MDLSKYINPGFSKFLQKKYAGCTNVRVILSKTTFVFTKKKSIYSKKSLFLTKAVKVTYLYDLIGAPSDWENIHDLEDTVYLTPKEFTYVTLLA